MADDGTPTPKKKWTATPQDEAAIRADERFRMALYTSDTVRTIDTLPMPGPIKELVTDLFKGHAADICISGADYSEGFELLPEAVKAEFARRQEAIEAQAAAERIRRAFGNEQAPLYDERDLEKKGSFVQLDLFPPDGEDEGNGNSGGGYLN